MTVLTVRVFTTKEEEKTIKTIKRSEIGLSRPFPVLVQLQVVILTHFHIHFDSRH